MDEVQKKEALLWRMAFSQPDAVRVDYQSRCDRLEAPLEHLRETWSTFDLKTRHKSENAKSPARKIEIAAFFGGALLNWWMSEGSIRFGFGARLMVLALTFWAGNWASQFSLEGELAKLSATLSDYWYQWKASGGTDDSLGRMRALQRKLDRPEFPTTDADRSERQAILREQANVWLNIRYGLLVRSRGTGFDVGDWPYELSAT